MQRRAQPYVRRPRPGVGPSPEPAPPGTLSGALDSAKESHSRHRRAHYGEHLEAARDRLDCTADEDATVAATARLITPHLPDMSRRLERRLAGLRGAADHTAASVAATDRDEAPPDAALLLWLRVMVEAPLDAHTGEAVASIARDYLRTEHAAVARLGGRHLLALVTWVQAEILALLAARITDPAALASAATAWNKRLMIHLDVFLAAYASAERGRHWY